MGNIEKAVNYMISIAMDDSHGYDQVDRNGNPDFDCSGLESKALNYAGFPIKLGSTTKDLYEQLIAAGAVDIPLNSPRKMGDILLKVGHHVAMCVSPTEIVHASMNENGRATGGKDGDQTGKEICVRSYYDYKGGWDHLLRFPDAAQIAPQFPYWSVMVHDGVRFRSKPNTQNSSIIRTINRGEGITVGQQTSGIFSSVDVGGIKGWIATQYLERS